MKLFILVIKLLFDKIALQIRQIIIKRMSELTVQVIDKRLQTDFNNQSKNEFINTQELKKYQNNLDEKSENSSQEDQQNPSYNIEHLLPKQNQRQRLIQQNIKLKTQIYELAKQLDQILTRDRNKKKRLPQISQQSQLVKEKKLQVKRQQIQILQLKNKIFVAKRQLQTVYNNVEIQAKEDELKHLKMKFKTMCDQNQGLIKIKDVQIKALKVVRNEQQYGGKINSVKQECARLKVQTKQMIQKINTSEKSLMKIHENYISKLQKMKDIQQKLFLNKQKQKNKGKKSQQNIVTQKMIANLQEQIKQLEQQKRQGQKAWQQKIRNVDTQLQMRKIQEQKKLLILRQKQKESKINQLKIRQLRKLVKQDDEGPRSARRSTQDMDMSQYRHKRNIRYIEK